VQGRRDTISDLQVPKSDNALDRCCYQPKYKDVRRKYILHTLKESGGGNIQYTNLLLGGL
jgi:hypothetical protein